MKTYLRYILIISTAILLLSLIVYISEYRTATDQISQNLDTNTKSTGSTIWTDKTDKIDKPIIEPTAYEKSIIANKKLIK